MNISLICPALRKLVSLHSIRSTSRLNFRRFLTAPVKKFYKNVSIAQAVKKDGDIEPSYEILLDQHKLRTPAGNLFLVPSELLALAVAQEWDCQKEGIRRHCLYITNLCYRALDYQTEYPDEKLVDNILAYVDTDTIRFRSSEPEDLAKLQQEEWDPIVEWVNKHHTIQAAMTYSLTFSPMLSGMDMEKLKRLLLTYNRWGLTGLQSCTENLKSVLLTLAVVDGVCSTERVVELSRLEQLFQIRRWGEVPHYHEVETVEMNSRVAAAVFLTLVSHWQHSSTNIKAAPKF